MRVLLLQLDGKIPNLALMRLGRHHRDAGDEVELRWATVPERVERGFFDGHDRVYASLIFGKTRPIAERLLRVRPDSVIGGTGWDAAKMLAEVGVPDEGPVDYEDYPEWPHSLGFTQRGCRLKCSFCVVPRKEGKVRPSASIWDIWRGEPHPRNILLLDNDFFGQPDWSKRIDEMRSGGFRVSFNQGFNVRLIDDEQAAAIAGVPYYDDQFRDRRLYTAWDNRKDEGRLFRNLEALVRHGVKPDHILVYMLVGYDHATKSARPLLTDDDFHRHARLRDFGCRPYPMPYVRARQLVGFQRWCVGRGAYHKTIPWAEWEACGYEPRRLRRNVTTPLFSGMCP